VIRRQLPRIRVPGFDHGAVSWGKKANGNGSSNGNGSTASGEEKPAHESRSTRLGARRGRQRSGRR
jgi:hypothetical protein